MQLLGLAPCFYFFAFLFCERAVPKVDLFLFDFMGIGQRRWNYLPKITLKPSETSSESTYLIDRVIKRKKVTK